jgi:ABC-type tungstate transport system substrate-binding protein
MRSPSPPSDNLSDLFVSFVVALLLFGGAVLVLPVVIGWVSQAIASVEVPHD